MIPGRKQHSISSGFTVVEMLVIIVVIGILATLTVLAIGNWRERTAETEVKSDLAAAAAAMENARNFGNGYPASIPTTFKESENVNVTLVSSTTTTYCAEGESDVVSGVVFHVGHDHSTPEAGGC